MGEWVGGWCCAIFSPFSSVYLSHYHHECDVTCGSHLSPVFFIVFPLEIQLYLHTPDLHGNLLSYCVMFSIKNPLNDPASFLKCSSSFVLYYIQQIDVLLGQHESQHCHCTICDSFIICCTY